MDAFLAHRLALADETSADPRVQGVRRFAELLAAEPRLVATALKTDGVKGRDGFAIALVVEPGAEVPRFSADRPDSARFRGLIRGQSPQLAPLGRQKMADFCGFEGARNKSAKRRLTESRPLHICPVTEAVLPGSTGSFRNGRHN
jgi:hypothetical protein